MPGGRRQPSSHLGKPVGRAVARTRPYPIRVYLRAGERAQEKRQRVTRARYTRPIGRAIARTYARPILVILAAVKRVQIPQRRYAHSHLSRPVGRAIARTYAYPIRVYSLQANRRASQRRYAWHSIIRRPIGRAIARVVAYPVKVYLAVKRAVRPERRAVHSRRIRPFGSTVAAVIFPKAIRRALTAVWRASREKQRGRRNRLGKPVGRAVSRTYAYPVAVYLQARHRAAAQRRRIRSILRKPFGWFRPPRPVQVHLQAVPRAAMVSRRRVRSLRLRPIGRAIARALAYPVKVVGQARSRLIYRLRVIARPRLRKPSGGATLGPGSTQVFLTDAFPALVAVTDAFPVQLVVLDAFPARVFITDIYGGSVSFFVGKAMRIANWGGTTGSPTGGFRNSSGTLYDPSAPAIKYRIAGQSEVTVSGGSLTHDGTGLYSTVVTPTVDGDLMATAVSGDGAYADPQTCKIEPAPL